MSAKDGAVDLAGASAADSTLAGLLAKHQVRAAKPLAARHVRAKQRAGMASREVVAEVQARFPARAARAAAGERAPDLSGIFVFDLGPRSRDELADTLQTLRNDPSVLYVEEEKVARAFYVPNDPSYSTTGSWGQSYDDLHGLKRIGAAAAWDVTRGQGVTVAVVDTGIDYNHPDISANIWTNPGEIPGNGIDDDNNGFIDDVHGWDFVGVTIGTPADDNDPYDGHFHGTHVAGTIAATGDNNLGVVGVAWQAKVMALKGLDDSGFGPDSSLARAVIYATDNGADIINASWGGRGTSLAVAEAFDYARAHGVVCVVAAGNSRIDARTTYPANLPSVITVSALAPDNALAGFSNFGDMIDVAAPGVDILSLQNGTSGYSRHDGTSMAAPHVSGVAALVLAHHPAYTAEQVRQVLRASATDLGPVGRDTSFGYGRVDAAQAVSVDQVLEAKFFLPVNGAKVAGATALVGTVGGAALDHYIVDYAAAGSPGSWVTIRQAGIPVTHGDLGTFDPASLSDGVYTLRLRAFSTGGTVFEDRMQVEVRFLEITSPEKWILLSTTQQMKPGSPYEIAGSARGPSFQHYLLEWAPGKDAISGWSTTGFTLAGNGLAPVSEGKLADWTPPSSLEGYHTLRLTVTNAGFSSQTTTRVYLQPALLSAAWPKRLGVHFGQGAVPVRRPDGSVRLALRETYNARISLLAPDGSSITAPLWYGTSSGPVVADFDGLPGDEIVVGDGPWIKIFSSDLTLIRSIDAPAQRYFGAKELLLADLDNDGVPEIIAPAIESSSHEDRGEIYAYRFDGTPVFTEAPSFHIRFEWEPGIQMVAVNLDQAGANEIVVAHNNPDGTSYTLTAYNANGTRYGGWGPLTFPSWRSNALVAADLDGDGSCELVLTEKGLDVYGRVVVFNANGTIRAGWPRNLGTPVTWLRAAIGDLDGNGGKEIVLGAWNKLFVLKADGTDWCPSWALAPAAEAMTPLIVDSDGNGVPEIFAAYSTDEVNPETGEAHRFCLLDRFSATGTRLGSWPLFGLKRRDPYQSIPIMGDFNGDGLTDIVVNTAVRESEGLVGTLFSSAVVWLTTGTPFGMARSDWTSQFHDPQNSRTLEMPPLPVITSHPAGAEKVAGEALTLSVTATSPVALSYQWQKDGVDISGATSATYTIARLRVSDRGDYRVRVTNAGGSVTSNVATIDVIGLPTLDLNGDGQSDILWRNPTSGELAVWIMNGSTRAYSLSLGSASTAWQTAGFGDFNDDAQTDILWRNPTTGELAVWIMNGATRLYSISLGISSTAWQTAGTGDFNNDGQTDILWRNPTTGELAVWFMNGSARLYSISLGTSSPSWQTTGTGDFNDDGQTDILWRNPTTGELAVWFMDGPIRLYSISLGTSSPAWTAAGTGDFNDDGQTDILWRGPAGELAVWLMDGPVRLYSISLGSASTAWQVVR